MRDLVNSLFRLHQNFVYFLSKYIIVKISIIFEKIAINFQIKLIQGETYES